MSILYACTLAPLELFYKWFYLGASLLSGSLVAGLFALSFLNAFILIPLTRRVGFIQDAESKIQGILAPQIALIKGASTGAVRHERIRNLYARYGYHPIFALRSGLGVFLQLPFLFAAFNMLHAMPLIRGVPFGIIADLGQPDGLLFGLNLLPFVMTAINLGVTFTSKGFDRRARIQAIIIALLFLALLYPAASALLVFWTTNNLILLLKNLLPVSRLRALTGRKTLIYSVWAALLAFFEEGQDERVQPPLQKRARALPNEKTQRFRNPFNQWFPKFPPFKKAEQGSIKPDGSLSRPLAFLSTGMDGTLFTAALACLATLLALFSPTALFLSDPASFDRGLAPILLETIPYVLAGVLPLVFLWLLLPRAWHGPFTFAILAATCAALLFAFVVTGDYGALDLNLFAHQAALFAPDLRHKDVLVFGVVLALLAVVYRLRAAAHLRLALWCFAVAFAGYTGYGLLVAPALPAPRGDALPAYSARLMDHSKTGGNVVVFLLDSFTGGHMENLLRRDPALAQGLSGFTWYPDALSSGEVTIHNLPAMYGGPRYAPLEINRRQEAPLLEVWNKALASAPSAFARHGYDVALANIPRYDAELFAKHAHKDILAIPDMGDDFAAHYQARTGQRSGIRRADMGRYVAQVALFRIAPHSLRAHLYDNGQWHGAVEQIHNAAMGRAYNEVAFFDSLAHLATAASPRPTAKFIYSMLPHIPWFLADGSLEFVEDPYPATTGQVTHVDGVVPEHIYTEEHNLRFLIRYFDWMRDQGIYDDATIVLVSDHGFSDSAMLFSALGGNTPGSPAHNAPPESPFQGRPHVLFMVKEPHAAGPLQTSDTLLSNADVPSFLCERIGGCPDVPRLDELKRTAPKRRRTYMQGAWDFETHPPKSFRIESYYTVNGTMFDINNWQLRREKE